MSELLDYIIRYYNIMLLSEETFQHFRPTFYTSRILGEQNLRKKSAQTLSKFKSRQNYVFNQIYFTTTVFNIGLYKTAT